MIRFVVGTTLLVSLTQGSEAASFDCSRARALDEISICHDERLSGMDERIAQLYNLVRKHDRNATNEQRAWLKVRAKACFRKSALGSDRCLQSLLEKRIDFLEERLAAFGEDDDMDVDENDDIQVSKVDPQALRLEIIKRNPKNIDKKKETIKSSDDVSNTETQSPEDKAKTEILSLSIETYQYYILLKICIEHNLTYDVDISSTKSVLKSVDENISKIGLNPDEVWQTALTTSPNGEYNLLLASIRIAAMMGPTLSSSDRENYNNICSTIPGIISGYDSKIRSKLTKESDANDTKRNSRIIVKDF